jgi:short-subunit dehydrogenase
MSSIDSRIIIKINCEALTNITRLSLDYMHENSNIINLASSAAFVPQPGFAVYAASKSYVLSFSQALSKELKKAKIYVTAVCPGTVDTPFIKTAEKYQNIKGYKKFFMSDEKRVVITALWDAKKHRSKSVYGIWMKLLLLAAKLLPVRLLLMFMK